MGDPTSQAPAHALKGSGVCTALSMPSTVIVTVTVVLDTVSQGRFMIGQEMIGREMIGWDMLCLQAEGLAEATAAHVGQH